MTQPGSLALIGERAKMGEGRLRGEFLPICLIIRFFTYRRVPHLRA